jgi:asparagine synthase (glutamine-hydrolysing)
MWAFAIWDKTDKTLFLSRDRFAIKPLYYIYDGEHFTFASEMKAFLALEWFDAVFDNTSVASELARMNDFEGTEHCLLHGVRRLNAGHCLTVRHSEVPMLKRWWNTLEHLDSVPKGFDQQVEKFRTLFFDCCRIRMRSDVAIGTALSGGLDSSSVLCAMNHMQRAGCEHQRLAADWQHAFVATFPGTVQDERQYAEEVVRATGVNSTYARMSAADAITYLDDALFDFEEIDLLPTPVWSLYRQMRANNVVVSLDGHGADEMLVGYYWYPEIGMREALSEYLRTYPSVISDAALERVRNLEQVVVGLGLEELGLPVPRAQEILDELSGKARGPKKTTGSPSSGWLRKKPRPVYFPNYRQDVNMMPGFDGIAKRMYLDFHYRTLPTILRDFDRCSMSNGVEVRAPFMLYFCAFDQRKNTRWFYEIYSA